MKYQKTEDFLNVTRSKRYFHKLCASVSTAVLKARIKKQMSQKDFAKYMGVSQGMVSRWENGHYNFTLESIAEICDKIEYSPVFSVSDISSSHSKTTIVYLSGNNDFSNHNYNGLSKVG